MSLFNNSFSPSNIPTLTNDNSIATFSDHDTPEAKLAKLGYKYDEANNKYTKVDNDGRLIEYMPSSKIIVVSYESKTYNFRLTYHYNSSRVCYVLIKNNESNTKLSYDVPTNSLNCIEGDCKNYKNKIDYILSIYKEINTILQ